MADQPTISSDLLNTHPMVDSSPGVRVVTSASNPAKLPENQRAIALMLSYNAGIARNYQYAGYNPDALIASKGYIELDKMLTMAPYASALNVIFDSALYKGATIKPNPHTKPGTPEYEISARAAEEAQWCVNNIIDDGDVYQSIDSVLMEQMMAVHHGFSTLEVTMRPILNGPPGLRGKWGFKNFSFKLPQQIGFEVDPSSLAIRNLVNWPQTAGGPQYPIPVEKVLLTTFNKSHGLPYGNGVARAAYKHYIILDMLFRIWTLALEIHGVPHYLVKAPMADENSRNTLLDAFDAVRKGSSLILPEGIEAELQQLSENGLNSFSQACQYHGEQITLNVLLQTLTTHQGSGQGSYALGAVHQQTGDYRNNRIRTMVEREFSCQPLRRWMRYNYGPDKEYLHPWLSLGHWDAHDQLLLTQSLQGMITSHVVSPTEPWIRERLNYPMPDPEAIAKLDELEQAAIDEAKAGAMGQDGRAGRVVRDPNQDTAGEDNTNV